MKSIAFPGATGTEVYGINDHDDIVGVYKDQNGVLHGFEAVPVPEPSAFVLLVAALVATITWQCQRSVTLESVALPDDQIAFFVIPAVTKVEGQRRRIALLIKLHELGLVVLFEDLDRADVVSENPGGPLVMIEIGERNAGVVLHDRAAMIEDEIADAIETVFKHQVRRRFK